MTLETESHQAKAVGNNLPVSWKDCTEIGRFLKGDSVEKAERKLEMVQEKELEVPYTKFQADIGHRPGQSQPGRYPIKAAEKVLEVIKSAKHNAEYEGLNPDQLEIQEFVTNQGKEFRTPGRHPGTSKAAHVKIIVGEK